MRFTFFRRSHLPDSELLLLQHGELPSGRQQRTLEHLGSCTACSRRARVLDRAFESFQRFYEDELPPRSAADDAASVRLRARMAKARDRGRVSPVRRLVPATAAVLSVAATVLAIFGVSVKAEGPRPDKRVTPGETRNVTVEQICSVEPGLTPPPAVSAETRRRVFSLYGMDAAQPGNFEVDYLITPELGGAASIRNLWPQPYSARWNAHVKDVLETRLHRLVCTGSLTLAQAQHDIAVDWIGAYRKYVSVDTSR